MTNHSRRRQEPEGVERRGELLAKVNHELSRGYLEVEPTGLSLQRLTMAHVVLLRGAWSYTLESVRSLLRPTAAL